MTAPATLTAPPETVPLGDVKPGQVIVRFGRAYRVWRWVALDYHQGVVVLASRRGVDGWQVNAVGLLYPDLSVPVELAVTS